MPFQMYLAYINSLSFAMIQMVLYTTIPYISEKTGVETYHIVGAISIGSFIFAFMAPFWASKSDQLGRKKVLSINVLGLCLSFSFLSLIFIFNHNLPIMVKVIMVYMARIIYGFLCAGMIPVSQAWQLDMSPKLSHIKVLTRNSMCLNLGRILGPILVLIKGVNFEIVLYAATFLVFSLGVLVYSAPEENENSNNIMGGQTYNLFFRKLKLNFFESKYPILLALVFTSFVGILYSFLGFHVKSSLGITGHEATLMFAKIILVLSLAVVLIQQLSLVFFKTNWKPRVSIGSVCLVMGTIVMMYANSEFKIWISIGFISIASALIPPAYLALTSNSKDNEKTENVFGKKLGLSSVAHSLGYALGGGLIALSMKKKLVSEELIVIGISLAVLYISWVLIFNRQQITLSEKNAN